MYGETDFVPLHQRFYILLSTGIEDTDPVAGMLIRPYFAVFQPAVG
jgi:hypothetical protein